MTVPTKLRESWNPLVMANDREFINLTCNRSPNQLIREYGLVFTRPFIVLVEYQDGGGYWAREDWDCPVPVGAYVRFVELPRGGGGGSNPIRLIAMIALVAAAAFVPGLLGVAGTLTGSLISAGIMIGGSLLLNMFFGVKQPAKKDQGQPETVYSINDGGNSLRIGQPFAECFGRIKRYPDLIQLSYTRFENNEQYLYFYMIIGVGEYAIEGVFIDSTPMDHYQEAQYRILPPGQTQLPDGRYLEAIPSIVPNLVWTSREANGQELQVDWITATVSARGTSVLHIEYDVLFPALVGYDDEGDPVVVRVPVVSEARLIDDYGNPTSDWVPLHSRVFFAASKDTLRYSNQAPAPLGPGRYEFRVRRTVPASESSKIMDKAQLVGLRGYGGEHPWYGNITCLEGRVRASDKISGEVVNKINVVCTRKLHRITNSGFEHGLHPTTSIVDAICYMVRSINGGRQDDQFFRFDVLTAIKMQVDGAGHQFNWAFTSQTSVMDAAVQAAQSSRMVPYMPGGQFCLVRDDYQELPAVTYTADDYDEGSLQITYKLAAQDDPTCVRVNFVNMVTWSDDFVVYYDAAGSEERPYEVELGCVPRQQAYEHAAYLYKDMVLNPVTVEFTTGLKGHIPALFKKILIDTSHADLGQSGKIVAVEPDHIWLSEPADFKYSTSGWLYITQQDGTTGGPYTVSQTENPYKVGGAIMDLLTMQDDDVTATSYMFGPAQTTPLFLRLMGIRPQGRDKIAMLGTVIDDATYDLPGKVPSKPIVVPDADPLISVSLSMLNTDTYLASWIGSAAAYRVEVNVGSGYTILEDPYAFYSRQFTTSSSTITVRITPYAQNVLLITEARTTTLTIAAAPANLVVNAGADVLSAEWDAVVGADGYQVSMVVDDTEVYGLFVSDTSVAISPDRLAEIGGPWPSFEIRVAALVNNMLGRPAAAQVHILMLPAPDQLVIQSVLESGAILSWSPVTNAGGYVLMVGESADFNAVEGGVVLYKGGSTSHTATLDLTPPYTYYFRVAAHSVYHSDPTKMVFGFAVGITS